MKRSFLIIFLGLFLSACNSGGGGADEESTSTNPDDTTINQLQISKITGKRVSVDAGSSSKNYRIGPIVDNNGANINNQVVSVKSSQLNLNESLSVVNGFVEVSVGAPEKIGSYRVDIKGANIPSVTGFLYLDVIPNKDLELKFYKTEVFSDSNGNSVQDDDEAYGLYNNRSTQITLGPFEDKFQNKIINGEATIQFSEAVSGLKEKYFVVEGTINFSITTSDITPGTIVSLSITVDGKSVRDISLPVINNELLLEEVTGPGGVGVADVDGSQPQSSENVPGFFPEVLTGVIGTKLFRLTNNSGQKMVGLKVVLEEPFSRGLEEVEACGVELLSGESCILKVDIFRKTEDQVDLTSFISSSLRVSGSISGESSKVSTEIFGTIVKAPELAIKSSQVTFDEIQVGTTAYKVIEVQNTGGKDAIISSILQPRDILNQNEDANENFLVTMPTDPAPGVDIIQFPATGYCGTTIPINASCYVVVKFEPEVELDASKLFITKVNVQDGSDLVLTITGNSFINDFEEIMPIILTPSEGIKKDNNENLSVTIGPLLRKGTNQGVPGKAVNVRLFSETINGAKGVGSLPAGRASGINGNYIFETDQDGLIKFTIKSTDEDVVGPFKITAAYSDIEGRVLSKGEAASRMRGAVLAFGDTEYLYDTIFVDKAVRKTALLGNYGDLPATSISLPDFSGSNNFTITDEGSCQGVLEGTLSLAPGATCSLEVQFKPQTEDFHFLGVRPVADIPYSSAEGRFLGQSIATVNLFSVTSRFEGDYLQRGKPVEREFAIANIGGEDGRDFKLAEIKGSGTNASFVEYFKVVDNCPTRLKKDENCTLRLTYDVEEDAPLPQENIVEVTLIFSAVGDLSGEKDELEMPVKINYTSMRILAEEPGINLKRCYPLQLEVADAVPLEANVAVALSVTSSQDQETFGDLYSDAECETLSEETVIDDSTRKSPVFYYKPLKSGLHTIKAELSDTDIQIVSTRRTFEIFGNPTQLILEDRGRIGATLYDQGEYIFPVTALDNNQKAIPHTNIEFDVFKFHPDRGNLIENGGFNGVDVHPYGLQASKDGRDGWECLNAGWRRLSWDMEGYKKKARSERAPREGTYTGDPKNYLVGQRTGHMSLFSNKKREDSSLCTYKEVSVTPGKKYYFGGEFFPSVPSLKKIIIKNQIITTGANTDYNYWFSYDKKIVGAIDVVRAGEGASNDSDVDILAQITGRMGVVGNWFIGPPSGKVIFRVYTGDIYYAGPVKNVGFDNAFIIDANTVVEADREISSTSIDKDFQETDFINRKTFNTFKVTNGIKNAVSKGGKSYEDENFVYMIKVSSPDIFPTNEIQYERNIFRRYTDLVKSEFFARRDPSQGGKDYNPHRMIPRVDIANTVRIPKPPGTFDKVVCELWALIAIPLKFIVKFFWKFFGWDSFCVYKQATWALIMSTYDHQYNIAGALDDSVTTYSYYHVTNNIPFVPGLDCATPMATATMTIPRDLSNNSIEAINVNSSRRVHEFITNPTGFSKSLTSVFQNGKFQTHFHCHYNSFGEMTNNQDHPQEFDLGLGWSFQDTLENRLQRGCGEYKLVECDTKFVERYSVNDYTLNDAKKILSRFDKAQDVFRLSTIEKTEVRTFKIKTFFGEVDKAISDIGFGGLILKEFNIDVNDFIGSYYDGVPRGKANKKSWEDVVNNDPNQFERRDCVNEFGNQPDELAACLEAIPPPTP
jgi:hypothetical protein